MQDYLLLTSQPQQILAEWCDRDSFQSEIKTIYFHGSDKYLYKKGRDKLAGQYRYNQTIVLVSWPAARTCSSGMWCWCLAFDKSGCMLATSKRSQQRLFAMDGWFGRLGPKFKLLTSVALWGSKARNYTNADFSPDDFVPPVMTPSLHCIMQCNVQVSNLLKCDQIIKRHRGRAGASTGRAAAETIFDFWFTALKVLLFLFCFFWLCHTAVSGMDKSWNHSMFLC